MKNFPIIALLAIFCAIYSIECQVVRITLCEGGLQLEFLLEFHTADKNIYQKVFTSIYDSMATDSSLTDAEKQEMDSMMSDFILRFEDLNSVTNPIYGELVTLFKPLLKKMCKATPVPCGLFVPYNAINYPDEPIHKAYFAGKYRDGTPAYIGGAFMQNCSLERYLPARCHIKTYNFSTRAYNNDSGCFTTCGSSEYRVKNPVAYLQYNFDFAWKFVDKNNASTEPNAVKIKGAGNNGFYIGRIQLNHPVLGAYTQVGKVYIDNDKSNLVYSNEDGIVVEAKGLFEVLTCESPPLDNNFVNVTAARFANNYNDGFELALVSPNDARVLHSTINWLLITTGCLAAWLYAQNYQ